jgi:O-antigen ligase
MKTLMLVVLFVFGIGCATSNSLMSAGVHLWSWLAVGLFVVQYGREIFKDRVMLIGFCYLMFTLVGLLALSSVSVWWHELGSWMLALYFVLAFAALPFKISDRNHWRLDFAVALAHVGLWGWCVYQSEVLNLWRITGIHHNPNRVACALLPAIVYFGQRLLAGAYSEKWQRFFMVGVLVALFHTILLTKTRSVFPFVVIFYGYLVLRFAMTFGPNLKSPRTLGLVLVSLLGLGAAVVLSSTASRFDFSKLLASSSVVGRFEIWKINWQMFLDSPVWGTGFKQNLISVADYPSLHPYVKMSASGWFAHNTYLQVLAESGIVGFVLFFGFLGGAFIYKPHTRWFVIAILTTGLTETILYIPRTMPAMIFFITLSGLAAAKLARPSLRA